jgi:hypothetical protein
MTVNSNFTIDLFEFTEAISTAMALPPDDDYELAWRLQREEQLAFQKEQERQRGGIGGSGARAAAGDGRGRLLMEYVQQLESAMEPRE